MFSFLFLSIHNGLLIEQYLNKLIYHVPLIYEEPCCLQAIRPKLWQTIIDPCPNCLVVLANKQYSVGRVYLKSLFSILYAPFCFFIFFMINKQQKK